MEAAAYYVHEHGRRRSQCKDCKRGSKTKEKGDEAGPSYGEDTDECHVCLASLGDRATVTLKCGHRVHSDCEADLTQAGFKNCPVCGLAKLGGGNKRRR